MRGRLVLPFFLFFKAANFAAARVGQPVPQAAFDCRKAGSACFDRDRSRRTHTRRPDIFSACTLHRGASGFPAQRDRLFPRWSARPPPAGVRRLCEPPKVITLLPSNRFLAFLDLCSRGERKNRGPKAREEARRKRGVKQGRPARKICEPAILCSCWAILRVKLPRFSSRRASPFCRKFPTAPARRLRCPSRPIRP